MNTTSTTSSSTKTALDCSPSVDVVSTSSSTTPARSRWLYIATAALSLIGLADSIYLTVKHLTGQSVQCTLSTGCDEVLASAYATMFGFPLAMFGAAAYFTVFSLATLALFGYRFARPSLIIVVGLMTLMALRLLYLQAFVLGKYCEFCLLSAATTFLLAVIVAAIIFGSKQVEIPRKKVAR